MPKALNLLGEVYGDLTVIEKASTRNGKTYWLCKCSCGKEKEVQTCHLRNGSIKSCGCKKNQNIEKKEEEKKCPICEKMFVPNNRSRKYCYDCSPMNRGNNYTSLYHAMKHRAIELKGGKCERCGYDKIEDVLEFHHINPEEKTMSLGEKSGSTEWSKFFAESQKCMLLCANCHREIHYYLRNNIDFS